ncbi:MAG: hypothetical protein WCF81_09145 [Roseiarcus sp.]
MARIDEIEAVDRFIASDKRLSGAAPEFGPRSNSNDGSSWEAVWPIANPDGVVETGQVRVRSSPASDKPFSIVLIFQDNCVFRVDFVDKSICHINPLSAVSAGLPPLVCGPHCHTWDANRVHLMGAGDWELRLREPLAPQIRKFEQAFVWFAQQVNISLLPRDRLFELPAELF